MLDEAATLVEVLAGRAAAQPDQVAYRFLSYPGRGPAEVTPLTYAGLDAWARSFAARLLASAEPGDRVLVLCPPGLEYVAAFFGCLYAGMAAIPAFPPTSTPHLARVDAIAQDADARLVIVGGVADPAGLPEFGAGSGLRGDRVVLAASVPSDPGTVPAPPGPEPGQLAFLQYTSGSTADPKGVMVSHANLMANARAARQCFGLNPASEAVSWLPPYHDMGLIGGIIFPLYTGFPSNLMSPLAFLRDPARWLEAVTSFRATVCPAPSFSYQMCADRVGDDVKRRLDLSTWTCALNGAEPVRPDVMRRFADAFAGCGFRHSSFQPCYGLAEATLVVSGGPPGAGPVTRYVSAPGLEAGRFGPPEDLAAAQPLTSSGQVPPDTEVAIVDPQAGTRAEPGRIGEIWVRGPAVAGGYFRQADATSACSPRASCLSPGGPVT
jgi:acyl-CoA synthetase (AMP-forming)/AMP-acid ligase II